MYVGPDHQCPVQQVHRHAAAYAPRRVAAGETRVPYPTQSLERERVYPLTYPPCCKGSTGRGAQNAPRTS